MIQDEDITLTEIREPAMILDGAPYTTQELYSGAVPYQVFWKGHVVGVVLDYSGTDMAEFMTSVTDQAMWKVDEWERSSRPAVAPFTPEVKTAWQPRKWGFMKDWTNGSRFSLRDEAPLPDPRGDNETLYSYISRVLGEAQTPAGAIVAAGNARINILHNDEDDTYCWHVAVNPRLSTRGDWQKLYGSRRRDDVRYVLVSAVAAANGLLDRLEERRATS